MTKVQKYFDFLEKVSADNPSDCRPFTFPVLPKWLETKENDLKDFCVFLSFSNVKKALEALIEIAPSSKKAEAVEDLIRFLRDADDEDFDPVFFECVFSEEMNRTVLVKPRLNNVTKHTLFNKVGQSAHGTRRQLKKETGLTMPQIADLLSGRRQYAKGWALTEERAAEGPRRPGRPRKRTE